MIMPYKRRGMLSGGKDHSTDNVSQYSTGGCLPFIDGGA
jgi:hypothetical protein